MWTPPISDRNSIRERNVHSGQGAGYVRTAELSRDPLDPRSFFLLLPKLSTVLFVVDRLCHAKHDDAGPLVAKTLQCRI
jgi:hypothetical protein